MFFFHALIFTLHFSKIVYLSIVFGLNITFLHKNNNPDSTILRGYDICHTNQLITYYLPVCYLLRIQQYPVNTTYNNYLVWIAYDRVARFNKFNNLLSNSLTLIEEKIMIFDFGRISAMFFSFEHFFLEPQLNWI